MHDTDTHKIKREILYHTHTPGHGCAHAKADTQTQTQTQTHTHAHTDTDTHTHTHTRTHTRTHTHTPQRRLHNARCTGVSGNPETLNFGKPTHFDSKLNQDSNVRKVVTGPISFGQRNLVEFDALDFCVGCVSSFGEKTWKSKVFPKLRAVFVRMTSLIHLKIVQFGVGGSLVEVQI